MALENAFGELATSDNQTNGNQKTKIVNSSGDVIDSFGGATNEASKIVEVGDITYVGKAVPGSVLTDAVWKAYKIDADGNTTWADGNANYDNRADDLANLTYS